LVHGSFFPAGCALIEYWRGRLGKAERSIPEALAEVYPEALTKEEVAAKAAYEANVGVSITLWAR
jgi:hypothetical protein